MVLAQVRRVADGHLAGLFLFLHVHRDLPQRLPSKLAVASGQQPLVGHTTTFFQRTTASKFIFTAAIFATVWSSCKKKDDTVEVTKITLNQTAVKIIIGQSETLSVTEVFSANTTEW